MRVSFYGACREVTGSNILVEAGGKKILFDCGLYQGNKIADERNHAPFLYDPKSIDFVVVGHAHLDHTGRLPKLVKDGFCGKIFSTGPTKELTLLVLADSEKLMREEAQRNNHPPLYSEGDIEKSMELFESITYHEPLEIAPGVKLTLFNAGHILGSAVIKIEAGGVSLVYTSDLGNNPSLLLNPPEFIDSCDFLICESTYGGRIHEDSNKRMVKLANIIDSVVKKNGVLMIPTFAIERTQELLHDIEDFCSIQGCEKPDFYLDSPLALKVTNVFKKYSSYLNGDLQKKHQDQDFFGFERLHVCSTVEDSKAINTASNPKVIIAGSGMMNGGRILFHIRNYISDPNNTLLIVGYQAKGTLGRRLFEEENEISVFGEKLQVRAQIVAIGSYSAHADSVQLVNWISKIENLKKVFLVHGENEQALFLSAEIEKRLKINTIIPQQGENYELKINNLYNMPIQSGAPNYG
ncbi:hypothetical protein A3A49_01895 [Candidatus Curtissbacteria bacterium RIFCSPLOWO2_01_FULL_38_11b]|uniref:MBL fold hydrolase n=1 Tax=Candidatus Curtissbacteria bacterium RIFCSPLOWO2_01_FULL_38_11b TaxID=1797725 RepID=A0A1F5H1J2_9BACT|nr:MAG: hypothetical protein A3A49_01895 [Candidatus Curtissbacteria bacterium RIFCSPLOWO2_01_FULL_38_11b]